MIDGQWVLERYAETLRRAAAPGARQGSPKGLRRMLAATAGDTALVIEPAGRTWIWSDLHLRHANIIRHCNRPFAHREQMDDALLDAWESTVGPDDTVLCGGDVALAGALGPKDIERIRRLPGRKLLVRGNHDFDRRGRPAETGFDQAAMAALVRSDPPLIVTHLSLGPLPDGHANVYGHVHNNAPLYPGPRINACVEHTGYKPLALEDVLRLAAALLAGRTFEGRTTAERIAEAR